MKLAEDVLETAVLVNHQLDEFTLEIVLVFVHVFVETLETTSNVNHSLLSSDIAAKPIRSNKEELFSDMDDWQGNISMPNNLGHSLIQSILPWVEVDRWLFEQLLAVVISIHTPRNVMESIFRASIKNTRLVFVHVTLHFGKLSQLFRNAIRFGFSNGRWSLVILSLLSESG